MNFGPCVTRTNFLLLVLPLLANGALIEPDSNFAHSVLIHPRVYLGREKRSVSLSSDHREETGHARHLIVDLDLADRNLILDLQINWHLVPEHYFEKIQENGQYVIKKPALDDGRMELCHYNGRVRNVADSWVAVSTCHGIEGVIYDGNETFYVQNAAPLSNRTGTGKDNDNDNDNGVASLIGPHRVYRHSHLASNFSCGTADPLHASAEHAINPATYHRLKRNADAEYVHGPYNANRQSRYVEMVLVADNQLYREYKADVGQVIRRCKDLANVINSLYAPLNIFVALVGVVIWTERDEFVMEPNGDKTLTNFLAYRKTKLVKEHPNDNAQLLTRSTFDGGVVGKALKGPICTYEFSGGVNVDHSSVVGLVATTIAHELGHNLGMEHDTENNCYCPKERCIMAPSSSSYSPTEWSSCSREYLALAFEHGMDYCLRNKPKSLFDGPVCGNGFVEPGEQCDCGLEETCKNICCDPSTCRLHANASCATGECCNLQTCQPQAAGTTCRSAEHECDLPEYCNGESEYCPDDVFKINGEPCAKGIAYCYNGNCRSHTGQCKILWGPSGTSSNAECYKMNTKGDLHGNCGYNRLNKTYIKCDDQNIVCGMLQCKHYNEKLEFGLESAAILSQSFISAGQNIISCRTALVDFGLNEVDPGLAPDGAKCGENHMCLNKKCMPVDSLRRLTVPDACPGDCNGHGICNSKGHCHCDEGFAPPDCASSGVGGSEDSGPAEDPQNYHKLRKIFWYLMLALVPLVLILFLYPRYVRKSPAQFWKGHQRRTVRCEKTVHVQINGGDGPASGQRQSLVAGDAKQSKSGADEQSQSSLQDSLLGNFKGFSIVPLTKNASRSTTIASPSRPAPTSPAGVSATSVAKAIRAAPSSPPLPALIKQLSPPPPPHLPPPNRPLISSPVLDDTTSTAAKKLIDPNCTVVRPAPVPPVPPSRIAGGGSGNGRVCNANERSWSAASRAASETTASAVKEPSNPTLSRIASLISKAQFSGGAAASKVVDEKRDVVGAMAQKAAKIDRDTLKRLKISDPIPLTEPSIQSEPLPLSKDQHKCIVMRAHSMRHAKKTQRAAVHSFGSMRLPVGAARPTSVVACSRPTSPPPRPPAEAASADHQSLDRIGAPAVNSAFVETDDNIYAVIEENPVDDSVSAATASRAATKDGFGVGVGAGLLDEIVNEIQARNLTSVYSSAQPQHYENTGSECGDGGSSEYLKPIKTTSSRAAASSSSRSPSVSKLNVPEKSAPGYRPLGAPKKPTLPAGKPATNSSQSASSSSSSSVSAAITKYNGGACPAPKANASSTTCKGRASTAGRKWASASGEEAKLPKTSKVASLHRKFENRSESAACDKRGRNS